MFSQKFSSCQSFGGLKLLLLGEGASSKCRTVSDLWLMPERCGSTAMKEGARVILYEWLLADGPETRWMEKQAL